MADCSRSNIDKNKIENDFLKYFELFTSHIHHQNQNNSPHCPNYSINNRLTNDIQFHCNLDKSTTNGNCNNNMENSNSSLTSNSVIMNDDHSSNIIINKNNNCLDNISSNDEEYSRVKSITLTTENGQEYKTTYLIVKSSENNIKTKNKHKVALRTMYYCQKCPYKLIDFSRFKLHLLRHKHELGSIKCRYCDYYDFTSFKMRQHESLHPEYHPIECVESNEKMHSCHLCRHKTTNACQLRK
jgi:hypothetical protein